MLNDPRYCARSIHKVISNRCHQNISLPLLTRTQTQNYLLISKPPRGMMGAQRLLFVLMCLCQAKLGLFFFGYLKHAGSCLEPELPGLPESRRCYQPRHLSRSLTASARIPIHILSSLHKHKAHRLLVSVSLHRVSVLDLWIEMKGLLLNPPKSSNIPDLLLHHKQRMDSSRLRRV